MSASAKVVFLLCRGDHRVVADTVGEELRNEGYQTEWDGLWSGYSQKQRERLRREAAGTADVSAVLLTRPMPKLAFCARL
jgi:hypothetical protein